jgi:hypothetical protein
VASDSDSGHDSGETDLETEWLFPSDVRSDPAARTGSSSTADTKADADRFSAFDEAAFGSDNSGAFGTKPRQLTDSESPLVTGTPAPLAAMPRTGQPRKWVLVVDAILILLVGVAAVAAIGRGAGTKSSFGVPVVGAAGSTSTTSRAQIRTTIAPPVAPSAPTTLASTPTSFTVRASCGGADCAVAVRESPSTGARQVASLRTGQIVQTYCSARGDSVDDRDTGRRSDVWYRFAGANGYSSALYLDGPTVPDCG